MNDFREDEVLKMNCEQCKKPIEANDHVTNNGRDLHKSCEEYLRELQGEWQAYCQQEAMDRMARGL